MKSDVKQTGTRAFIANALAFFFLTKGVEVNAY